MSANAFAEFDRFHQTFIDELKMLAPEEDQVPKTLFKSLKETAAR